MYDFLLLKIILFIVYLFPQSLFIIGVYLCFQGKKEIRPDGKTHYYDSSMIFFKVADYLSQYHTSKIFYADEQLDVLLGSIKNTFGLPGKAHGLTAEEISKYIANKVNIESAFDLKMEISETGTSINFYREYTIFHFPKVLRKPIFGCVICMASFWSIITFLLPMLLIFNYDPIVFCLYIPNALCLACLNYKLYKPL